LLRVNRGEQGWVSASPWLQFPHLLSDRGVEASKFRPRGRRRMRCRRGPARLAIAFKVEILSQPAIGQETKRRGHVGRPVLAPSPAPVMATTSSKVPSLQSSVTPRRKAASSGWHRPKVTGGPDEGNGLPLASGMSSAVVYGDTARTWRAIAQTELACRSVILPERRDPIICTGRRGGSPLTVGRTAARRI